MSPDPNVTNWPVNLIIDENLPPRWCEYLNSRALVATHWTRIGNPGDPDSPIIRLLPLH